MAKWEVKPGQVFGKLTVVSDVFKRKNRPYAVFQCDCGKRKEMFVYNVMNGQIKSCGCLKKQPTPKIGDRFGKLTVISQPYYKSIQLPTRIKRVSYVNVLCDCGIKKEANLSRLRSGKILSCGCLVSERTIEVSTTHGLVHHPLYGKWCAMKERCNRPANKKYALYGGRGIKVCDEWQHDFKAFYDWSISHGWKKGLEIDRIDTDGNYCPSNCRYVSHKFNTNNKRNNHTVEYNGEKMSLTQAIEKSGCGLKYSIVFERIHKLGYSIGKALTMPKKETHSNK